MFAFSGSDVLDVLGRISAAGGEDLESELMMIGWWLS
jgi:hypothetical protein